ncbi:MAG: alpha/beta hydrolase fold domain-containing protein [Porticoccaceae bacterium]|nr:alpha/beta hydrolase fold domain-containing protein [Porticoccaceae bacterium]
MYQRISLESQRVLLAAPRPTADRCSAKLPTLRAEIRNSFVPAVSRVLNNYPIKIDDIFIGSILYMRVMPTKILGEWPIIYGFGGGFVTGSPFEDLTIAAPLASLIGAQVITLHYRHAPEHPWTAAIDDGFEVYQALAEKHFALAGKSAGGNFTLSLMLRAKLCGVPLPGAVALLSPCYDLTHSGYSLSDNDGRDPTITTEHIRVAAIHYAGEHSPSHPTISPINGPFDETFPSCMITTGTRELLMSQAITLNKVMRENDVNTNLKVWHER